MLMFLRDARRGCVDVFVVHCCDNVAVVIQSITSYCALLSSRFLSPFPLGVCVCVCVRVVSQGMDAIAWARMRDHGALADEIEVRPRAMP
jgi:hypothetical protein